MRFKILFLLLLGGLAFCQPAYASVKATLDSDQTSLDKPVRLTIVTDQKQAVDKLDISALEQNFKIIGQSSSSQISMRNGTVSTEAQFFLDLLPRREGELTIPALVLGNEQTDPLVLKVSAAGVATTRPQQDEQTPGVLIEAQWETPGKAYVQSQLNLIIRIYHRGNLLEAALDEPRPMDTLVRRIGDDLQGASSKDGIQYQTIERHYALFPQKSGTLTIPAIAMQMRIPNPTRQNNQRFGYDPFSRGMQLTLKSQPLSKEIAPPADGFTGHTWLPSDKISLNRSGLPESPIRRGDAINMRIDLSALGLSGKQLPEVQITGLNSQFKLYPDQPSFTDSTSDGQTIQGNRSQTFVLIASESGMLEIPEIQVAWWDRQRDRQQFASLPAVKIEVLAPEPGAETTVPKTTATNITPPQVSTDQTGAPSNNTQLDGVNTIWKWISLASLSGWLLSIVYIVYYRRTHQNKVAASTVRQETTDLRPLLKRINTAASENKAQATWAALQAYARARWPEHPPQTPKSWAKLLHHPEVRNVITQLDTHLFRNQQGEDWKGEGVCKIVLPKMDQSQTREVTSSVQTVPELYPPRG